MVPSADTVEDVWVGPLAGLEIEDDEVGELGLRVPSSIGVELVIDNEDGVTSTAWWGRLSLLDWLILMPGLSVNIEAVDVVKGLSGIVETSMATIDVDFVSGETGTTVGSWGWSTNGGLLVLLYILVTLNSVPSDWLTVLDAEPPAVIEAHGWSVMATED